MTLPDRRHAPGPLRCWGSGPGGPQPSLPRPLPPCGGHILCLRWASQAFNDSSGPLFLLSDSLALSVIGGP